MRTVKTVQLEHLVRGLGGHWHRYVAYFEDDDGQRAYGQTAREAELELRKREESGRPAGLPADKERQR
jgi:hypothetical protein